MIWQKKGDDEKIKKGGSCPPRFFRSRVSIYRGVGYRNLGSTRLSKIESHRHSLSIRPTRHVYRLLKFSTPSQRHGNLKKLRNREDGDFYSYSRVRNNDLSSIHERKTKLSLAMDISKVKLIDLLLYST